MAQGFAGYNIMDSEISFKNSPNLDAFGRLRVSNPFTLFDSSHRFDDNELWSSATATGGAVTFNASQGLVDLAVTAASGSEVIRETTKVFSYQPGKSLLILSTFVMSPAKTNLRQRVGYYGTQNGLYFQLNNSTLSFVERSLVSGSVTESVVNQSSWNVDKMDGTGPSGITLDITKAYVKPTTIFSNQDVNVTPIGNGNFNVNIYSIA
jgi:hypothetical protein